MATASLSDTRIGKLKENDRASEKVSPHGSLYVVHRRGRKEYYYRYTNSNKQRKERKLGNYPDLPLVEARKAAQELAEKTRAGEDLNTVLMQERLEKAKEERAREEALKAEQNIGTLWQLCEAYLAKLEDKGAASLSRVRNRLTRNVLTDHPELADRKARDITAEDVLTILKALHERGTTTQINRVRDDLNAAFNVGMKYDYSFNKCHPNKELRFKILNNPVACIEKERKYECKIDTVIDTETLRLIWHEAHKHIPANYASILRVLICTGLHGAEWMRARVKQFDREDRSLYMTEMKNRDQPNLVLLNRFACAELESMAADKGPDDLLFRPIGSKLQVNESILSNKVALLRKADPRANFVMRDIRRTLKTKMGDIGIDLRIRDLVQNHKQQGVSSQHYDRSQYRAEKQEAVLKWEHWLAENVVGNPEI